MARTVSDTTLNRPVSDSDVEELARYVTQWEKLRSHLGLDRVKEEEITQTFKDYGKRKTECIEAWREKEGNKATYRAFIAAAEKAQLQGLADRVKEMLPTRETAIAATQSSSHSPVVPGHYQPLPASHYQPLAALRGDDHSTTRGVETFTQSPDEPDNHTGHKHYHSGSPQEESGADRHSGEMALGVMHTAPKSLDSLITEMISVMERMRIRVRAEEEKTRHIRAQLQAEREKSLKLERALEREQQMNLSAEETFRRVHSELHMEMQAKEREPEQERGEKQMCVKANVKTEVEKSSDEQAANKKVNFTPLQHDENVALCRNFMLVLLIWFAYVWLHSLGIL